KMTKNTTNLTFNSKCYNVRGLNAKVKRAKCLDLLRRKNVDVAFIQETHLKAEDTSCFQNKRYKVVASDCWSSNSRGTVILTKRSLGLEIEKTNEGTSGCIAYLCTSIYGKKIALVSVYAPTVFDPLFFPELTKELLSLLDYELIVGGDMNTVCDPNLDKSTLSVSHTQRAASAALN
uniref:exodeoxyribonuclease III n=1 Tax=Acanthochromis polyacanthus TaxID=80966 RepID=A0A3Q1GE48_9TELE